METKPPTITDHIKWLLANKDQLSLFFEVERVGFIKGPVNQCMRQLIAHGLVKKHTDGVALSEQGRLTVEAFEALGFIDKIA